MGGKALFFLKPRNFFVKIISANGYPIRQQFEAIDASCKVADLQRSVYLIQQVTVRISRISFCKIRMRLWDFGVELSEDGIPNLLLLFTLVIPASPCDYSSQRSFINAFETLRP